MVPLACKDSAGFFWSRTIKIQSSEQSASELQRVQRWIQQQPIESSESVLALASLTVSLLFSLVVVLLQYTLCTTQQSALDSYKLHFKHCKTQQAIQQVPFKQADTMSHGVNEKCRQLIPAIGSNNGRLIWRMAVRAKSVCVCVQ